MGFEKPQDSFDTAPLARAAAETNDRISQFETEDGYNVRIDRTTDPRGLRVEMNQNGQTSSFLVIDNKLYNAEILTHGRQVKGDVDSIDQQTFLNQHGLKLTQLVKDGKIA